MREIFRGTLHVSREIFRGTLHVSRSEIPAGHFMCPALRDTWSVARKEKFRETLRLLRNLKYFELFTSVLVWNPRLKRL